MYHFIYISHLDAFLTLKESKSGLRQADVLPLLQIPVFLFSSKLKPFFFLIILYDKWFSSGCTAVYPKTLNSLHIVHLEMHLLSLLNIVVRSSFDFLLLDLTKRLSYCQMLFFITVFHHSSPLSFQVLIIC